ncbi:hypothetical protein JO972_16720 [Verrucomicrobiaceae bacterium 5K15]|uniref:Uncharacterized protein n=1 Tax=Oceaniferula flava TaxID=2800421 RepID=A0AAE2SE95_9BACT|nr:hypothetical protein [Oceaniferula flavus]MBK1856610.1 hypothetical protein [Oceaniferula flavus]MBM1137918.1 hypothetical protein [Oceaniferula flavus]
MKIDDKNALKAISIVAAVFWFIIAVCWFRETYFKDKYDKGAIWVPVILFVIPSTAAFYIFAFRSAVIVIKDNVRGRPLYTIGLTLWGFTPVPPIMFGLFLVLTKIAE